MQKDFDHICDEIGRTAQRAADEANRALENLLEARYGLLSKAMKAGDAKALRNALTAETQPELTRQQRATVYAAALVLQSDPLVHHPTLEDLVGMVKAELWQSLAKRTGLLRGIEGGVAFERAVREASSRVRKHLSLV